MSTRLEKDCADVGGPVPVSSDRRTRSPSVPRRKKKTEKADIAPSPVGIVREEWKQRLPFWMQVFLTWVIGCPYKGQEPLYRGKPWWLAVAIPLVVLASGLIAAMAIVASGGHALWLLPAAWLMQVNGARTLQVHICHQGVHRLLTGTEWLDKLIVEIVSTLLVIQADDDYREDHCEVHHPALASENDPDRQFTVEVMGLHPGRSVRDNRLRFFYCLASPRIHMIFVIGRLRSNLFAKPLARRTAFVMWTAFVASAVTLLFSWHQFFFAAVVPLVFLYSCSAICQFTTEHAWTKKRELGESAKDHNMALLLNRHLGDRLPPADCTGTDWLLQWSCWWLRLIFYHVPFRLGVLCGDLPCHGSHHLWPREDRWTDAIFAFRERSEASGKRPTELVGGYFAILGFVLTTFAEAKPLPTDDRERLRIAEAIKVANGM